LAEVRGTIFDIQKFAIHDGPGIRTTVFLKGCVLNCPWCHNPEALNLKPELIFYETKCIGCGACFEKCPVEGALNPQDPKRINRRVCTHCGLCTETCYAQALVLDGRETTVGEVLKEVEKDRPFYETSDGGMTVSGGEPLVQAKFATALLQAAKEVDLHTALDTSGCVPREVFARALDFVDLVLFDLKIMDSEKHCEICGHRNDLIHDNLRYLDSRNIPICIRVPVIPGYTDSPENIAAIAALSASLPNVDHVELLPYHRLGESKWARLDLEYKLAGVQPPTKEWMAELKGLVEQAGVKVMVEG